MYAYSALGQHYVPIDKGSKIQFSISQDKVKYVKIKGGLTNLKGKITFDPAHPEKAVFDITAVAGSVRTEDPANNEKVKSSDFLDIAHFPAIHIKSTSVTQDRPGSVVYILNGTLTLKGKSKPIKIQFTVAPSGDAFMFRGLLTLNRLDYGIGPKSDLANEVVVYLEVLTKKG